MYFAFTKEDKTYLYLDGILREWDGKLKLKDNIGYEIKYDNGKVKVGSKPVYDSKNLNGLVSAVLSGKIPQLNAYVFSSEDMIVLHFDKLENEIVNGEYLLVQGIPVLKSNKKHLLDLMDISYDLVKYMLKSDPSSDEIKRRAIISLSKLGKCEEAIELYRQLDSKYPEESLAAAECFERMGEELEALKIYSFFSEIKYRELEQKLRDKANKLIDEFEVENNVKLLFEALSTLPTYDAPALKLGWYFLNKKNYKEAVKYFEEALKRRRDFTNMLALANAYIHAEEYKKALDLLEEAEKIRRNAQTAYLKGLALERFNASSNAKKEFLFACREGVIEACNKIKTYELYIPAEEFDPNSWVGYVLYGYKVEKVIGTGGMGFVLLVEKNMKKFAMKVVKKEFRYDELLYEIAKTQEVSKGSKYLVRIFASFIDENFSDYYSSPPSIVMEYMEGGDLREILVNQEYSALRHSSKWPQIVAVMFSKLANAVIHIHKSGFIHCDIKPSNILFNRRLPKFGEEALEALLKEDVIPKISDLGSAVRVNTPVIHYTPYYAHPLQRFGGKAEYKFDIYSFTVSLYVTLTNNFPFPEWLERELEEAVTMPEKRENALKDFYLAEPRLDYVPEEFREIIERGLRGDITMEEIRRELSMILKYSYNLPINENFTEAYI